MSFLQSLIASGVTAAIAKTAVAPLDVIKVLKQVNPGKYNGIMGYYTILTDVLSHGGYMALWTGNLMNIARYFPTQSLNFAYKGYCVNFVNGLGLKNSFMRSMLSGCLAGCVTLGGVYWMQAISTRSIAKILDPTVVAQHLNILDLYNGFFVSVVGIVVYRAAYFGMYDLSKSHFKDFGSKFIFACGVTSLAGFISFPLDTIRCYQLVHQTNPVDTILQIFDKGGISGFWAGSVVNFLRGILSAFVLVGIDIGRENFWPKRDQQRPQQRSRHS